MAQLTIDGRHVSYLEYGSGAPIVLLHAGGASGKQWAKVGALLEPRFRGRVLGHADDAVRLADVLAHQRRVIAPDLWGFGGTEHWSGEQELTHDDQALLVAGVIEQLCKQPVHLVGHSYGGATAVRLMLRNMALVRTAVLIEPILTPLLRLAGDEDHFREVVRAQYKKKFGKNPEPYAAESYVATAIAIKALEALKLPVVVRYPFYDKRVVGYLFNFT